jgi:transcriptional regulator with XRE-family HTH domain
MTKTWARGSSTMVRRQLGRRLRALRVAASKTQEDVAATKLMSLGKLKLIEHGRSMVRPGDVYELGTLYGADPQTITDLRELASATTQGGWWQESAGGLVKGFETYLDLESSTSCLSVFNPTVISGLLQTEAYALAVDEVTTDPALGPAAIARNVRLRTQRLPTLLKRDSPPWIDVVLGEAALQLKVGDDEVMAAQREHLLEVNRLDNVTIKVLLHDAGPHRGLTGPFTILDFDDPEDPSVAYIDSYVGARYDDREGPVRRHREVFRILSAQAVPLKEYFT